MKIEKGIPVPASGAGRAPKYPFGEMEVGDSVFFQDEPRGSMSNPSLGAHNYGSRHGKKFTARKEGNGVRIWRIE